MPDNIPATPPASATTGAGQVPATGQDVTWTGMPATDPNNPFVTAPVDGQVNQCVAFPQSQNSPTNPATSTQAAAAGTTARSVETPVAPLPGARTKPFDTNKLVLVLPDRYLARIKEKRGVANIVVFDRASGNKQYRTASFIASNVQIAKSEAASITKTNEGFTLYSPDSNPTLLALDGKLFSGDDWANAPSPTMIGHTDWFSKFLTDYNDRLSSTASLANDTDIWFSYESVFANVFITNVTMGTSADSPLVNGFSMQMTARTLRVVIRPDLDGSGPDESKDKPKDKGAATDPLAAQHELAHASNGTGRAASVQVGDQGAVPPAQSSQVITTLAPDNRLNPAFTPQVQRAVAAGVIDVFHAPPSNE